MSFKRHTKVDNEGKASYPLPGEGQPANLPRLLGGKVHEEDHEGPHPLPSRGSETKNWEEGWYLWTSSSRKAALERLQLMSFDLEKQQRYQQQQDQRQEVWQEYQDKLKQGGDKEALGQLYLEQTVSTIRPPLVPDADRCVPNLYARGGHALTSFPGRNHSFYISLQTCLQSGIV